MFLLSPRMISWGQVLVVLLGLTAAWGAAPALRDLDVDPSVDPPFDLSKVSFSSVFSDSMVLQRAPQQASVYGTATPGASITVTLASSAGFTFTSPPTTVVTSSDSSIHGSWKVLLPARPAGMGYNLTAVCAGCTNSTSGPAYLEDVVYGDVYVCSGQSNMECPVLTTTARFETYNKTAQGLYDHIRLFQMGLRYEGAKTTSTWILPGVCRARKGETCPNGTEVPGGYNFRSWMLPRSNHSVGDDDSQQNTPHFPDRFSAVCWYFGKSLSDLSATTNSSTPPVPIGLIASTIGGTTIQQWMPPTATGNGTCSENNCGWVEQQESPSDPPAAQHPQPSTLPQCYNHSQANVYSCPSGTCSTLWHSMIAPFVNMTIAGALWYQGEQNVLWGRGSPTSGYQCQQSALIQSWRDAFSTVPGTSSPTFPFGVVTLAGGASEGGYLWTPYTHLSKAQWKDWGDRPNRQEVVSDWTAGLRTAQTGGYGYTPNAALPNVFMGQNYDQGEPCGCDRTAQPPGGCWATNACYGDGPYSFNKTHNYQLSGIHPRVKHIVGERLARALVGMKAGKPQPTPKLAGCRLSGGSLILTFDAALLGGESLTIQPPIPGSFIPLELQMAPWNATGNASISGWVYTPSSPVAINATSIGVQIPAGVGGGAEAVVPLGVRYAWGDYACCPGMEQKTFFCPPTACPIVTSVSTEPAVPFWAAIVDGKCKCDLPWICDA